MADTPGLTYFDSILAELKATRAELDAIRADRDAMRLELEGEKKANALLNTGMGSVCEGRDEMKLELRKAMEALKQVRFANNLYSEPDFVHNADTEWEKACEMVDALTQEPSRG